MRTFAAAALVFLGGFAIMVLEIVGARFLGKDFGGSFYVWTSQIGVILVALAVGYYAGGALADRYQRARFLTWWLLPIGLATALIPEYAGRLINRIILRHPGDQEVPLLWQKLDPALGSALIFLLPCCVLAMLSPFMIRLTARQLSQVGRVSGVIYSASTVGSIAGVFVSGYLLMDYLTLTQIFRATGGLIAALGLLCWGMDAWMKVTGPAGDQA